MEGWIRVHRKIIDAPWFNKSEYVHLWLYLLLKANHKDQEVFIGNEKVLVKRGQLLTSRHKLSEVVHIQENKIYRILKCFENEHQIEQHKTRKYTVISIVNYDTYQKSEQDNEQQMNNKRTADEQQMNTNNNDKNDNNIYLYLLYKYKKQIEEEPNRIVQTISRMKETTDYEMLTLEEQDKLFYDLMSIDKKIR